MIVAILTQIQEPFIPYSYLDPLGPATNSFCPGAGHAPSFGKSQLPSGVLDSRHVCTARKDLSEDDWWPGTW